MEKVSDFSKRLEFLLNANSQSATSLACELEISKSLISRYLSGQAIPRQTRLDQIARYFHVSHAWLMGYDCNMYESTTKQEILKRINKMREEQLVKLLVYIESIDN